MKPPPNTTIIEWQTSTAWFDEFGILCSISKKAEAQTFPEALKLVQDLKKLIGDKKVCFLVDTTNSNESTKEIRDLAAAEFPKFVKAMAVLSDSALGRLSANLFFRIKSQPYPIRLFENELSAREWLKQYI